ncbi:50S ribosomal protein L25 [Clostridiaceae bacterium 35-E11]
MSRPLLKIETRERAKKKSLKQLRKEGFVPGVLYGHNKNTQQVRLNKQELDRALNRYGTGASVHLQMEKQIKQAIIKDVQRHITKQHILHIDFQELDANEQIKIKIPLHLVNKLAVESSTTVIQQQMIELEIQTYPQYLPQFIEVDVSKMKFGEPLRVKDLMIPNKENIQVLNEQEEIVALLTTSTKVEQPVQEEDLLTKLY